MNIKQLLIEQRTHNPYTVSILTTKSGGLIVIDCYGPDDFGAWWTDENHLESDTYGCSVRGSLKDILRELRYDI